jgi:hypothetical protein
MSQPVIQLPSLTIQTLSRLSVHSTLSYLSAFFALKGICQCDFDLPLACLPVNHLLHVSDRPATLAVKLWRPESLQRRCRSNESWMMGSEGYRICNCKSGHPCICAPPHSFTFLIPHSLSFDPYARAILSLVRRPNLLRLYTMPYPYKLNRLHLTPFSLSPISFVQFPHRSLLPA